MLNFDDLLDDEIRIRVGDRQVALRAEDLVDGLISEGYAPDSNDVFLDDELGAEPYFGPGRSGQAKLRAWRRKQFLEKQAKKKVEAERERKRAEPPRRRPKAPTPQWTGSAGRSRERLERTIRPREAPSSGAMETRLLTALAEAKLASRERLPRTPGAREPHLDRVAQDVIRRLGPKLARINKRLRLAANQTDATSEHRGIVGRADYQRRVLKMLATIMKDLPEDHPVRQRTARVLGNVLGPAGLVVSRK